MRDYRCSGASLLMGVLYLRVVIAPLSKRPSLVTFGLLLYELGKVLTVVLEFLCGVDEVSILRLALYFCTGLVRCLRPLLMVRGTHKSSGSQTPHQTLRWWAR